MSGLKALAIVGALSLASAASIALVSRTPLEVRRAAPGPDATDPEHGAAFTDAEVARHAAYRGPAYLALGLSLLVEVALLVVLARGPLGRIVETLETRVPGGVVVHALALGGLVAIMGSVAALPISLVRGYAIERAWGLSTQGLGGFLSDVARSLGIGALTAGIATAAFFGIVRLFPRSWWAWGWVAFAALMALMTFIWPVLIAPLFNRFTPVQDEALAVRMRALARDAGVVVGDVLVADASRRTTAENAYVAGLGTTKQLVLYDNLLAKGDDDETLFVVAHELGHQSESHIVKGLLLSWGGLLAGFVVLALLARSAGAWTWAGASGVGDLRALPVLLLFALGAGLVTLPVQNAVSRAFEARADAIALELTGDPDTAVRVYRRLAFSNLADLRPPDMAVWTLFSHPPIPERIGAALAATPD